MKILKLVNPDGTLRKDFVLIIPVDSYYAEMVYVSPTYVINQLGQFPLSLISDIEEEWDMVD